MTIIKVKFVKLTEVSKIATNQKKTIDLKGEVCPYTFVLTKLNLEEMEPNQILEVILLLKAQKGARKMESTIRFGVSMEFELLEKFDKLIAEKGYTNRSEAIRDLIRDCLVKQEWEEGKESVGVITLVYEHELVDVLTELQHRYHNLIISTTHVHLDEHNCLEVVIAKGKGRQIGEIAGKLRSIKRVKYGRLVMATTGRNIP